jgi:hypothetical protein
MGRTALLCHAFILLGMGMLAGGAYQGARSFRLELRGAHARGTVVELVHTSDSEAGSSYTPRVRYRSASAERTFVSSVGTGWRRYEPGDRVSVLYDPENPEEARIRSFWDLWSGPALLLGMGLSFAWAGRAFLRQLRRTQALGPSRAGVVPPGI